MSDVYTGEKTHRNYKRYVLVSVIGIVILLTVTLIIFDIQAIEKPLHDILSEFVPPDAFVWQFIKIAPVIESPELPPARPNIIKDIIETIIDTSNDPDGTKAIIPNISDIFSDDLDIDAAVTPFASITNNDGIQINATDDVVDDTQVDLPTNVVIPEFVVESNRILSADARASSIGVSSIGDSFTGIVTEIRDGNSLYVDKHLLVLAGVKKEAGAAGYLAEICPVGTNAVYDIDDLQSLSRDGGLYAAVWCFVPGLTAEPANKLVLESGLAKVDYSCISSEFRNEDWLVDAGCPG